jgi:hypothetical protein
VTWIVDIEIVAVEEGVPPGGATVVFDVIYPGETWCRSVVSIVSDGLGPTEEVVASARDALLLELQKESQPVALELLVSAVGAVVQGRRLPGDRP